MTTFGTLATPSAPVTTKRNRHSVENDQQSALIKRINRRYASQECNRKVVVRDGSLVVVRLLTDEYGPAGEFRLTIGPATVASATQWLQQMLSY